MNRLETAPVMPAAATGSSTRRRRITVAFLVALTVPALSILLHEFGHFAAHSAFGYEVNRLTFASVVSGEPPPGIDPALADGLSFAAGATISLLLVGLAWLSLVIFGPNPVALAFVLFECIRGVVGLTRQIANFGVSHALGVGFGELRNAIRAFGGFAPGEVALSWVELGLPILVLVLLLRRHPRGHRLASFVVALIGIVVGLVLWIGVLGPRILPA